ncbi:MAG: acyltransferase family protein [Eubacterium sp.]|nr:acyltransferase family protein [Eubacterium sp.]
MSESKRSSNFELLRIIAMILIMISHIFQHSINVQIYEQFYSPGEFFDNFEFYDRLVLTYFARTFGPTGCIIFILISGYFLINKEHIDVVKQIKKLLTQLLFAALVLLLMSMVFFKMGLISTGMVIFDSFNDEWWFIGLYILIIVSAELIINRRISKLTQNQYIMCLVILFALISTELSRGIITKLASGLELLTAGIFVYLLGGYIRIYNPLKNLRVYVIILLLVFSFVIMAVSYYNFSNNSIDQAIIDNNEYYVPTEYSYYGLYTLPCLLIGVSLFELFRRIKMPTIGIINYIAGSTFMMYLIHENSFVWNWLMTIDWNSILYEKDYIALSLYLLIIVFALIFYGVIAYSVYRLLCWILTRKTAKKIFIKENIISNE